ncbi:MAG: DUF5672 family protein [Parcubacteria group bacterium]|jgi:hypothetical protein
MERKKLENVTLLGIDCIDISRLILAADICQKYFDFGSVKLLTSLESNDSNIVKINPIISTEEYSRFIIAELEKYVDTEYVLIFQYDGFILNPEKWTDEFLKYDYVGAPWLTADWSVKNFGFPKELLGKFIVGNGGFSLRSKKFTSLCSRLAKENIFSNYHPEDVVLCVHSRKLLESNGIKFAPVNIAKQFSFEGEDDESIAWDGQFGFHGLQWTDISKWLEKNPEYYFDKKNNIIVLGK